MNHSIRCMAILILLTASLRVMGEERALSSFQNRAEIR